MIDPDRNAVTEPNLVRQGRHGRQRLVGIEAGGGQRAPHPLDRIAHTDTLAERGRDRHGPIVMRASGTRCNRYGMASSQARDSRLC